MHNLKLHDTTELLNISFNLNVKQILLPDKIFPLTFGQLHDLSNSVTFPGCQDQLSPCYQHAGN